MTLNTHKRSTVISFLTFTVLFGLTYLVLGLSINWPQSLKLAANQVLPVILKQYPWVIVGYYLFVFTSLCLLPMAIFARSHFEGTGKPMWDLSVAIAIIAVLLRIIAIFRWLSLMPELAHQPSSELRDAIFASFNSYLDGFGTHWGDQLFTGLWLGIVSLLILKKHRFLGIFGLGTFFVQVVASVLDFIIPPGTYLSISQSFIYIWALLVGIRLFTKSA